MEFKLPEIGEGVQEGELIKWLVKNGDTVAADQPLLEVMTDKATVEVPAPVGGKISGISTQEGQMIKVGQVLAQIESSGSASVSAPSSSPAPSAPPPSAQQIAKPAAAASSGSTTSHTSLGAVSAGLPTYSPTLSSAPSGSAYVGALENLNNSTVPASPVVRAMAARSGVSLDQVPATGPSVGGRPRVLEEDLLRFLSAPQSSPAATIASPAAKSPSASSGSKAQAFAPIPTRNLVSGGDETERKPVRGLRRVIAQAMVRSKYTAPHYSYVDEFECSQLVALREEAKKFGEKFGVKITYLPFIVKAVVGALREFPVVNSSLEESANGMELVYKKFFHIGFAVATPDGLVVPVIKNADKKSLLEIAKEINDLSEKVRNGKASPEDLKGSTFSITSMGNVGGLFATPIINYPEVGILGVYRVQEKPIVKDGQIVVGKTMHLSLSLDHRVVDGAVGGYFCNAIIARLQEPARLLMEMV